MTKENKQRKRVPYGSYMRRNKEESNITFENAKTDWSIRYVYMSDILDDIDEGNFNKLDELIELTELEDNWCSFDNRLSHIELPWQQEYQYDSEGVSYESKDDVDEKVRMFKLQLKQLKTNVLEDNMTLEKKEPYDLIEEVLNQADLVVSHLDNKTYSEILVKAKEFADNHNYEKVSTTEYMLTKEEKLVMIDAIDSIIDEKLFDNIDYEKTTYYKKKDVGTRKWNK